MILIVKCNLCEQPVDIERALLIETNDEGSEGYFVHPGCHKVYTVTLEAVGL